LHFWNLLLYFIAIYKAKKFDEKCDIGIDGRKNKLDYLHFSSPIESESSRYLRKSKYLQLEHLWSIFSLTLLVQTKSPTRLQSPYLHNLMGELPFFSLPQKWAKIDIPAKFAHKHTQISANSIPRARGSAQWDHGMGIVRDARRARTNETLIRVTKAQGSNF